MGGDYPPQLRTRRSGVRISPGAPPQCKSLKFKFRQPAFGDSRNALLYLGFRYSLRLNRLDDQPPEADVHLHHAAGKGGYVSGALIWVPGEIVENVLVNVGHESIQKRLNSIKTKR